jgi:hypothetical protein
MLSFNVALAVALALGTNLPNQRIVIILLGELGLITRGKHILSNDTGERPPRTSTVERTRHVRIAAQRGA